MKSTLVVTLDCNLSCKYCYIKPSSKTMSIETAIDAINYTNNKAENDYRIDFGFFGGEPLLKFELIKAITEKITTHQSYKDHDVRLSIATNGTILNDEILRFINEKGIVLQISSDGLSHVHDSNRIFGSGKPTSSIVEKNIFLALQELPFILVNVVYTPLTIRYLSQSVMHLSKLGVRNIFLNPDYSSVWEKKDLDELKRIYFEIADIFVDFKNSANSHFISLIDEKIAIVLRNGYQPDEKCSMGNDEFAVSPQGVIFPCERLLGDGNESLHSIGTLKNNNNSIPVHSQCKSHNSCTNSECRTCRVSDYCMNWCGCSNYFASGNYHRVNSFICHSEKAAIEASLYALQKIDSSMIESLKDHCAGIPLSTNICREV
jgi:uncharacterized protein